MVKNPLVSVAMISYAHEPYIKEAIEGVLMQECDFDIELIVTNDRSPDNTDKVVKEILASHPKAHIIRYIHHKVNKGMMPNFAWTLDQAKGKYIAFCEGDDSWIDPKKLQKQVAILEADDRVGLVYAQAIPYEEQTKKTYKPTPIEKRAYTKFEDLLIKNSIPSPTICFRKDLFQRYVKEVDPFNKPWPAGDIPLFIWFAKNSKIVFQPFATSIYRILPVSGSRPKNLNDRLRLDKIGLEEKLFFCDLYKVDDNLRKKVYDWFYNRVGKLATKLDIKESLKECKDHYIKTKNIWRLLFVYPKLWFFKSKTLLSWLSKIENRFKYYFNLS